MSMSSPCRVLPHRQELWCEADCLNWAVFSDETGGRLREVSSWGVAQVRSHCHQESTVCPLKSWHLVFTQSVVSKGNMLCIMLVRCGLLAMSYNLSWLNGWRPPVRYGCIIGHVMHKAHSRNVCQGKGNAVEDSRQCCMCQVIRWEREICRHRMEPADARQ